MNNLLNGQLSAPWTLLLLAKQPQRNGVPPSGGKASRLYRARGKIAELVSEKTTANHH